MTWEHIQLIQSGECKLLDVKNNSVFEAEYELGLITTGKQRVFWGRSICLYSQKVNVQEKIQGDYDSFRRVLMSCNKALEIHNLKLLVAGNCVGYYETPFSASSGYGYIKEQKAMEAISIMAYVP
ncbi:MAG: hypothetical protein IT466_06380 [Moraxellaceae bacterium]|nr:hypothetical protein [Moraxellaceae bacterium]